jgi:hypothetical protein
LPSLKKTGKEFSVPPNYGISNAAKKMFFSEEASSKKFQTIDWFAKKTSRKNNFENKNDNIVSVERL